MSKFFRFLNDAFNGTGRCKEQCDTCHRVAGVLHTNAPPINTDVLVLLNLGQIRMGQWNGTSWHIHSDGLEQFLLNVSAWMPLPEIRDFYQFPHNGCMDATPPS